MKLNIEQGEIKRILEMHSKMKKTLLEQAPEQKPLELKDYLQGFVNNNCIPNGKVVEMGGTNPNYKWAVEQESTKTPGKKRYFFSGGTVGEFVNNKFVQSPTTWKCDEKSDLKQAFIDKANLVSGYKIKLTPTEIASGKFKSYTVPGSTQQFPPSGIIVYYPDSSVVSSSQSIEDAFKSAASDQTPPSKSTCKDTIRLYYKAWKTKKDIPDVDFDAMKRKVQACANEFDGKWGGILSNVDNYIETLRGGTGGPLSYGEDAKWRLK